MPLYEYECLPEHHRFEVRHGINEAPVSMCAVCGGEVRRVIQPVGIVFKGSGFYATDSRKSSTGTKSDTSSGDKPSTAKSESKSESSSTASTDSAKKD